MKCLHSENGTEFVNKTVDEMCRRNGIQHQRTVPYSPQQNGVAKRMNRTIMQKARSMLHYKGVSTVWWAEAVNTSVYLINRSTKKRDTSRLDTIRVGVQGESSYGTLTSVWVRAVRSH